MKGWIGVDLDKTLAKYDEWVSVDHVGAPIMPMVMRVRRWLADGKKVKIMTARVSGHHGDLEKVKAPIEAFCMENFGEVLEITNVKDFGMIELWDDRSVSVEPNTGEVITKGRELE
jgi:hypothetical protein